MTTVERHFQACEACVAGGFPEFCSESHTDSVVRLARALGAALAGPPRHPEDHPDWYIEDAEAIACEVEEGDGWVVEKGCESALADSEGFFKVNGVEFWFDWNAEGHMTPELGADVRAEMEAEGGDV